MNPTRTGACGIACAACLILCGCQGSKRGARLYDGFGGYHRPIATESTEAQAWFDQGMQLLYGFNHDEAIRSFEEAAKHDPASPMPWWGIAYAHGININDPQMTEQRSRAAREATDEALERNRENGWGLIGLAQAVGGQGRWMEASEFGPRLRAAWADADVQPTSSCYCQLGPAVDAQ